MSLDDSTPAGVESRNNSAAVTAMMIAILERPDQVRNASETEAAANDGGPGTVIIVSPRPPKTRITAAYWVVFPDTASTLVIALVWQIGQSTGAGWSCRLCSGTAVWNCDCAGATVCCWVAGA